MKKKANSHGGAREGAGRKVGFRVKKSKLKEKTKVIRVPVIMIKAVQDMIARYKESKNN